jgi:hypothetical protein
MGYLFGQKRRAGAEPGLDGLNDVELVREVQNLTEHDAAPRAMRVGIARCDCPRAQKFFIYVAILPKPVVSVAHAVYVTSLRPTIPKRIRPISRSAVA